MDFLEAYLAEAPVSIGLIRAIECERLDRLELGGRILDVGCGDGLFTDLLLRHREAEIIGIDPDIQEVQRAATRGIYAENIIGMAQNVPFPDEFFDAALSNSVLEHIPYPEHVIREVRRVLKPGGKLIFTVPSVYLEHYFFYTILLRAIGLGGLGKRYADFKNTFWRHHNLWPIERWKQFLTEQGFRVIEAEHVISKEVTIIGDILLPFAILSVFVKRVFHRYLFFPNPAKGKLQAAIYRWFYEQKVTEGAGLFFLAEKE